MLSATQLHKMPSVLHVEHHNEWQGPKGDESSVPVDGVVILLSGRSEFYVPFRAEDKGGVRMNSLPYVWEWVNPHDPIEDVSVRPDVTVDDQTGKVVNGQWIDNGD